MGKVYFLKKIRGTNSLGVAMGLIAHYQAVSMASQVVRKLFSGGCKSISIICHMVCEKIAFEFNHDPSPTVWHTASESIPESAFQILCMYQVLAQ